MDDKPKRKRDQQAAWWQFPRRFSYRIESDYETIIRILEGLEHESPGSRFEIALYSDGKGHETTFDLDLRVHGREGKWNIETHMTGRVLKHQDVVLLEATLMESYDNRNAILGLFAMLCVCVFGCLAIGVPIMALYGAAVMIPIVVIGSRSNRNSLSNHLLDRIRAGRIDVSVLSTSAALEDTELSSLNEDEDTSPHKSKSAS